MSTIISVFAGALALVFALVNWTIFGIIHIMTYEPWKLEHRRTRVLKLCWNFYVIMLRRAFGETFAEQQRKSREQRREANKHLKSNEKQ